MALFRKILFWTHLIAGSLVGIVVLIMSITGVLLTYEKQMISWSDREFRVQPPSPGAVPVPAGALVAKVVASGNPQPESLSWESDPAAPVSLSSGRDILYANPYTGEILGKPNTGMREFMSSMRAWHRWLAASGENRAMGKAITGASNVLFLFLVVSGIYLWMPRSWSWKKLRPIVFFRGGLRGKARDFNWHNVAGFWAAIPLFFVVLSAMVISYPWFSQFVIELADGKQPASTQRQATPSRAPRGDAASAKAPVQWSDADLVAIDQAFLKAFAESDWKTLSLRLPSKSGASLTATLSQGYGGQPQLRETLTLASAGDASDGNAGVQIVKREGFASQSLGRRIRTWMRFVHTGEYYGLTGQTIAGIASAAGVLLVYSGFALAVRRFLAWRRRLRNRLPVPQAKAA